MFATKAAYRVAAGEAVARPGDPRGRAKKALEQGNE
jgi:hypothetical protein